MHIESNKTKKLKKKKKYMSMSDRSLMIGIMLSIKTNK